MCEFRPDLIVLSYHLITAPTNPTFHHEMKHSEYPVCRVYHLVCTIMIFFYLFTKQNVLVNETFVHLLEVTCQEHPGLDVQYGGVGGFIAKKPPKRVDPMKVIQVCLVT